MLRAEIVPITIVILATAFVFTIYHIAGRVVGLSLAALCGAAMAFFLMPPIFSFRVSQTRDVAALVSYAALGLVLAKSPSKPQGALAPVDFARGVVAPKRLETEVSGVIEHIRASHSYWSECEIVLACEHFRLSCSRADTLRILSDVLAAALRTPGVQRLSILGGQCPGNQRLIIVAHRVSPQCPVVTTTVGKRHEDCEAMSFPGWHPAWRGSWFDNDFERIFQVTIETNT